MAAGDDLLPGSMESARRTVERTGGSSVKKHPTVVELSLLVPLALVVVLVYGVREFYVA